MLWLRTAAAQRACKSQVAVAIALQSVNTKEASNANCVNERCKILRSLNRVFVFEFVLCIGAPSKDLARFVDLGFWILRNKEAQEYKSSFQETNHNTHWNHWFLLFSLFNHLAQFHRWPQANHPPWNLSLIHTPGNKSLIQTHAPRSSDLGTQRRDVHTLTNLAQQQLFHGPLTPVQLGPARQHLVVPGPRASLLALGFGHGCTSSCWDSATDPLDCRGETSGEYKKKTTCQRYPSPSRVVHSAPPSPVFQRTLCCGREPGPPG